MPGAFASAAATTVLVAFLASLILGAVALFLDIGILYVAAGATIGAAVSAASPTPPTPSHRALAVVLTYFAVALSPLIAISRESGFDLAHIRGTALSLAVAFIPNLLASGSVIGLINAALLALGLRSAWRQSGVQPSPLSPACLPSGNPTPPCAAP